MKHNMIKSTRRTRLAVLAAASLGVVAAVTLGGVAAFAGNGDPTYHSNTGQFAACISRDGKSRLYNGSIYRSAAHPTCPAGYARFVWDASGTGPAGQDGQDGQDATLTITATTAVSNWPETSGWAVDTFTRTLSVTREHAAESAKCGGTPQCWFYTAQITDNGSFVTAIGHPSPNSSQHATITHTVSGTINGTARMEFYASSPTPAVDNVPTSATAAPKPASTSEWYKLAFAPDTSFAGGRLPAYTWDYTTEHEHWHDAINPGDDGQGSEDGDITGALS